MVINEASINVNKVEYVPKILKNQFTAARLPKTRIIGASSH
jgi:hypothetical protein